MWDISLDPFGRRLQKADQPCSGADVSASDMNYLLQIFDAPITIHRAFVELTGSLNAAAILSDLAAQVDVARMADDWLFVDRDDWVRRLGLSCKEQVGARKLLRAQGLIEARREGSSTFLRVNWLAIDRALRRRADAASSTPRERLALN